MTNLDFVPSQDLPNAEAALDRLLDATRSVRVAIAFVSSAGVDLLAELLSLHDGVEKVEVVTRGAPVTSPEALLALRDRVGVDVSVIAGPDAARFHPKLWLLERSDGGLRVLSGSGNLTEQGLRDNREQFEILSVEDAAEVAAQQRRFDALTSGAIPLGRFEGSIAWRTWIEQLRRRAEIAARVAALDRALAESHPIDREPDKQLLMDDLWELYELTLEAKLKKEDGKTYVPSGLRLQLEGKRGPKEPVPIAASICKSGTEGFDTILRTNNRRDLTVEWLVVDETKKYHDLFPEETLRLSAERLGKPSSADDNDDDVRGVKRDPGDYRR